MPAPGRESACSREGPRRPPPAGSVRRRRQGGRRPPTERGVSASGWRVHVQGWLLLLPAAVLLVAFTHFPVAATLYHSFLSNPKPGRAAVWVGADNYRAMVEDPVFWQVLGNNAWFALGTIPLSIGLAMLMAVWVNGRIPGRSLLRLSFFTPTVLPMIAV